MSTAENKAVFLSYASQDAEAARKICDALRAAGVEVWFDQSELRGGDAWDQKIRKQIKDCALFVPIISANTQARTEGYFRLEWRLADLRTHLMAKGRAFLVPVVIDGTRDSEARVPDSFLEVQWTRFADLAQVSCFAEQVLLLLEGDGVRAPAEPATGEPPKIWRRRRTPMAPLVWGTCLALVVAGLLIAMQRRIPPTAVAGATMKKTESQSVSERHVADAWSQLYKTALGRPELEIAEEHCRRALALDPNDPEALAAASHVDSWFNYFAFDRSAARREAARARAARALTLSPDSFEARLAQACYLVRGSAPTDRGNPSFAAEAEKLLRELLRERPGEPRALSALGILLRNSDRVSEAVATLTELAQQPRFAALAWDEIGWVHYLARPRDLRAAEQAIDRSIALEPYWGNLSLKLTLALSWHGDVALAKATLAQVPASILQEDHGVLRALSVFYFAREPEEMLRVLRGVPRDWFSTSSYTGPKGYWSGLAHNLAKRRAAAEAEWRQALKLVEEKLADQPNAGGLLRQKARLMAHLGERDAAEKIFGLAQDMSNAGSMESAAGGDVAIDLLLGRRDAVLAHLERSAATLNVGSIRLSPTWDELRNEPRFQAVLAKVEAAAAAALGQRGLEDKR